mmetsp:Transcript_46310/g.108692  ORF Transcript_46310/g.108692 Transcript_46310/m.108692 type:complete len:358 (-) Transcript_46310:367-1440(-)
MQLLCCSMPAHLGQKVISFEIGPFPSAANQSTHTPRIAVPSGTDEDTRAAQHFRKLLDETTEALSNNSKLQWVHIPKAGTSFGNLLVQAKCPGLFRSVRLEDLPLGFDDAFSKRMHQFSQEQRRMAGQCMSLFTRWGFHEPVDTHRGKIVTVVREPMSRIVSGYLYRFIGCKPMIHKYGVRSFKKDAPKKLRKLQHLYWDEVMEMDNNEFVTFVRENYAEGGAGILAYAKCVEGSQASILSGFGRDHQNKSGLVEAALQTLNEQVVFVGITDRWHETASLFLSLFGSNTTLTKESDTNVRPSIVTDNSLKNDVLDTLLQSGFHDLADEAVYAKAVEKFETLQQAARLEKRSHSRQTV